MEGTFLKQGIEKIEELVKKSDIKVIEVNGEQYSTGKLEKIDKPYYAPECINLNTLRSLADMIITELEKAYKPLFVRVVSPTQIDVFTTYKVEESCVRDHLYRCTAELPDIKINSYCENESFIIALRSKFEENEDSKYVLSLLSKITDTKSVSSEDNGLTQTVQARKGTSVALVENVIVKSRVSLIPYRTFIEVEQPKSEFLLRLRDGGEVAIFEADGGAWKLQAKNNILEYLNTALADEIINGQVVIIA